LGQSLGINNIPPKMCTYACAYCQLGRTTKMQAERREFYKPERILSEVEDRLAKANRAGEHIDYLSFVPDGEPTLDINLGREIELLRPLGLKVAVITNTSLIWEESVREALAQADWVSLKIDAATDDVWSLIDRPYGRLRLGLILDGALAFARSYGGKLATETMLVEGINDTDGELGKVADLVAQLAPAVGYLAIPTRPPAEKWVHPPREAIINQAYQIFREKLDQVELLIGYEGNAFAFTGSVVDDLLSITAVHPMREDAVGKFLARARTDWSVLDELVTSGKLVKMEYQGSRFYMRKLRQGNRRE
jgi:wyosine [tRNA(Phe)-imidazoG37] synthetase (radical SAM superfamily)